MSATKPEPQLLDVASATEFEQWLGANHATTPEGVWLRLFKKPHPRSAFGWSEAVDVALCFGWIDGQTKKHDDESRVVRFTPRRKRSSWSKLNTERVERLTAEGRMRPAGQQQVDDAKADGRWVAAYEPSSRMEVPADFLTELDRHPKAKAFFATLNKRNTYAVAYRLQAAKKPETRAKRVKDLIERFDRGEPLH